jgi:hypothetical protein
MRGANSYSPNTPSWRGAYLSTGHTYVAGLSITPSFAQCVKCYKSVNNWPWSLLGGDWTGTVRRVTHTLLCICWAFLKVTSLLNDVSF